MDLITDYRRKIIANSPHLMSASGAVVSFSDGADNLPLKSLNVDIEPVQSGTGDPSPTNIRPISGWNAVKVTRDGKNLLALPFVYYTGVSTDLSNYFFVKAGTYAFSFSASTASSWRFIVRLKDLDGNVISDSQHNPSNTLAYRGTLNGYTNGGNTTAKELVLNIAEDCYIRILHWMTANPQTDTFNDCKLEEGSTVTPYEPYNGVTVTVDLGQTVYGGTLNPLTGVLTVDAELEVFNNVGTNIISSNINYLNLNSSVNTVGDYTRITFGVLSAVDQSVYNRASNTYKYKMCNLAPHKFSYNDTSVHWYRNTALYLFLPTSLCGSTAQSVLNYLVGVKDTTPLSLWIPLAQPFNIQLTPQQIRSLYGNNTIFADTGNVALEYWAHP